MLSCCVMGFDLAHHRPSEFFTSSIVFATLKTIMAANCTWATRRDTRAVVQTHDRNSIPVPASSAGQEILYQNPSWVSFLTRETVVLLKREDRQNTNQGSDDLSPFSAVPEARPSEPAGAASRLSASRFPHPAATCCLASSLIFHSFSLAIGSHTREGRFPYVS